MPNKETMDLIALYANVFGAISTFIAAAVALWFGSTSQRNSKQQALDKANLVAARISASLATATNDLRDLSVHLTFSIEPPPSEEIVLQQNLSAIAKYFNENHKPQIDLELLMALTPLSNRTSLLIARAQDTVEEAEKIFRRFDPGPLVIANEKRNDDHRRTIQQIHRLIDEAVNCLGVASQACAKAAQIGAPPTTDEERHGEG
jgi:hypothetical protein